MVQPTPDGTGADDGPGLPPPPPGTPPPPPGTPPPPAARPPRPARPLWPRIVLGVIAAVVVVYLLFTVVFPWVQEYQDDPTLEAVPARVAAVASGR